MSRPIVAGIDFTIKLKIQIPREIVAGWTGSLFTYFDFTIKLNIQIFREIVAGKVRLYILISREKLEFLISL